MRLPPGRHSDGHIEIEWDACPYSEAKGHQHLDPQKLTPASKRARRGIAIGYVILGVAMFAGFRVSASRALCTGKRSAWDQIHAVEVSLGQPLPTDGLSGSILAARVQSNRFRAAQRAALMKTSGERPSC